MLIQTCNFEPEHTHEFPDDWQFGGPHDTDPRMDPRWSPDVYVYLDEHLIEIHTTTVPFCDDEAIDAFTEVAGYGPTYTPKWIRVKRAGETAFHTLPFEYNHETDEVYET